MIDNILNFQYISSIQLIGDLLSGGLMSVNAAPEAKDAFSLTFGKIVWSASA
jgi:hypothetical protein